MRNRVLLQLAAGIVLGLLAGYVVWGAQDSPAVEAGAASTETRPGSRTPFRIDGRPTRGPADAAVEFVEFTDYECPFCKRFYSETYPEILAEYGDRVKFVTRNFPLVSIHAHAAKAAEAAECAFEQNHFWEYHDWLFDHSSDLEIADLKRYARELGMEGATFDSCLDSGSMQDQVVEDVRDGIRFGVSGTPSFFINGQVLVGAQPVHVVRAFIEMALEEAAEAAVPGVEPVEGLSSEVAH